MLAHGVRMKSVAEALSMWDTLIQEARSSEFRKLENA
jgi:hypothetical protein